jgi:hypothetical protein
MIYLDYNATIPLCDAAREHKNCHSEQSEESLT